MNRFNSEMTHFIHKLWASPTALKTRRLSTSSMKRTECRLNTASNRSRYGARNMR